MKKFSSTLSIFTLVLAIFCVPLMTADASMHHMVGDGIEINCDSDSSSGLNCCFDDSNEKHSAVLNNGENSKSLKLFHKTVDFNWPKDLKSFDVLPSYIKVVYLVEPASLLVGSTIKLE